VRSLKYTEIEGVNIRAQKGRKGTRDQIENEERWLALSLGGAKRD